MSLTPLTFTGVSSFSNDFQTILDRAAQVAQVPIQQLQNKDADILQRKTLLSGLANGVGSLSASLASIGALAGNKALGATSSDSTKVSVVYSGATSPASYTIDSITSAASAASERTVNPFADADPVSSTGDLKLVVGSQEFAFSLTTNTLAGLRDKINGLGAGVTASILTTPGGNYLSVTANTTGAQPLQLIDDPDGAATSLLTSTNPGTNAVFSLNGIPITQSGNIVNNVIPGAVLTIQAASATPVTITLSTDRSQLASALQNFAAQYNSLRGQVTGQIGPAAGLLSGSSVISQLANNLRQLSSYRTDSGQVRSLSDLGIVFDNNGQASFSATTFNALSDSAIHDAFNFLGTATSGFGGFSATLNQIGDPVTGLIKLEQTGLDASDKALQNRISVLNERITVQQNALAAKLHAADALLGTLASQQQQLTASLQGLSLTLYGKNQNQ